MKMVSNGTGKQPYEQLEIEYANYVNTAHACVVNTGTAALHLAIEALKHTQKYRYDSQVIVPDFTMYASGLAVYYARLNPVFIDCDDNLLIDLDKVEEYLENQPDKNKTRILMITHVYGRVVDMKRVDRIAKKYNLRVIEDACEAQGAEVGSYDIGCFSFYRNKIIHAEEGGMITSNDEELINLCRDMRSMSFGEDHNYYHKQIGFNYRCTNSQAEMALDSLDAAEFNIVKRKIISKRFMELISKKYHMPNNREADWVFDMKHKNADTVVKILKDKKIQARHSFKPLSLQPLFRPLWASDDYDKHQLTTVGKKAKFMSDNVFYVNIDPNYSIQDIEKIGEVVNEVLHDCDNI